MTWTKGNTGPVEASHYTAATFLNGMILWSLVRKSIIVGAIVGAAFGIIGRIL